MFLFLGYHLHDWNFRAMLDVMQRKGRFDRIQSYAVRRHAPEFERQYWEHKRVRLIDMEVDDFLRQAIAPAKDDRDGMGAGDEQPPHDASVDGFSMDQYEVTNAQYQQCVDAGRCKRPHYADGTCYRPRQQGDKWDWEQGQVDPVFQETSKPVVCVDWEQAQAYCKFVDKRLPTEAE